MEAISSRCELIINLGSSGRFWREAGVCWSRWSIAFDAGASAGDLFRRLISATCFGANNVFRGGCELRISLVVHWFAAHARVSLQGPGQVNPGYEPLGPSETAAYLKQRDEYRNAMAAQQTKGVAVLEDVFDQYKNGWYTLLISPF
jgi:hypothetical protein